MADSNAVPWEHKRYYPVGEEPPRLPDGSVDIRALCRRLDEDYNQVVAAESEQLERSF